ncbi:MAG: universal stress protein [Cyanobacteria bacterium J06626_26]
MFQRILVALDRSNSSRSVLEEAIALAKPAAKLNLVTVVLPVDVGYSEPVYLGMEGLRSAWTTELYQSQMASWQQHRQEIEHWLRSQTDYVHRQGISVEYTSPIGAPGTTLCDVATQWDADLIMMGRRGRSGFSELLLGSISNYVMHHAPCSVLTVQGLTQPPVPKPSVARADRTTPQGIYQH